MSLLLRIRGKIARLSAEHMARRPATLRNPQPIITFTFDDFPESALYSAGRVLSANGVSGTYYASLGLMGTVAPTGKIFRPEDVKPLLDMGHELGCHTYDHFHAYDTPAKVFEASLERNRLALAELAPQTAFRTLSYPISAPSPSVKRRCAPRFAACRAGGQTHNLGSCDLNNLRAFFIEQSVREPARIFAAIDAACAAGGWLIFATHDVLDNPTRYGCTPKLFEEVVQASCRSGARVLSMTQALEACSPAA